MTTAPPKAQLVLASQSQYKQQQLKTLALPFTTFDPSIDESPYHLERAKPLAQRLAKQKARAWQQTPTSNHSAIIIGSDQTAVCKDVILGKPYTVDNAIQQLEHCSGHSVVFYSAICLLETHTNTFYEHVSTTHVTFKTLSRAQIEHYIQQDQPLDCAGSFKSEGLGIALFSAIHSNDPTALVGLPLIGVCDLLHTIAGRHAVFSKLAPLGLR